MSLTIDMANSLAYLQIEVPTYKYLDIVAENFSEEDAYRIEVTANPTEIRPLGFLLQHGEAYDWATNSEEAVDIYYGAYQPSRISQSDWIQLVEGGILQRTMGQLTDLFDSVLGKDNWEHSYMRNVQFTARQVAAREFATFHER